VVSFGSFILILIARISFICYLSVIIDRKPLRKQEKLKIFFTVERWAFPRYHKGIGFLPKTYMKIIKTASFVLAKKKEDWNPNPWAVCHKSVGKKKTPKFERCVQHVKRKQESAMSEAEKLAQGRRLMMRTNGPNSIDDQPFGYGDTSIDLGALKRQLRERNTRSEFDERRRIVLSPQDKFDQLLRKVKDHDAVTQEQDLVNQSRKPKPPTIPSPWPR